MINNIIDVFKNVDILEGIVDTLLMVIIATFIAYLLGTFLGVIMVCTDQKGIMPNRIVNFLIGLIVNLGRSIPFIILLIALIPFTRFIVGTSLGVRGMVVPLSIGAIPFVARLVESSLKEVDQGVIDAAITMGCPKLQIVFKVYLREAVPSLIRGISITMITLVGYSAMSGTVGGGGLGDIAIVNGYYNFDKYIMFVVIIVIIILVQIIQVIFDLIVKKIDRKNI